jgi:L-alanine-DL-glutamate epimerase-like enolase superfamily enzyme
MNKTIITKIECIHYKKKLSSEISDARNTIKFRTFVLIKIYTNKKLIGFGEAASFANSGDLVVHVIKHISKNLLGKVVPNPEDFYNKTFNETLHFGRRGLVLNALSGLDIALWDLKSKVMKIPIKELLNINTKKIDFYFNGGYFKKKNSLNFLKNSFNKANNANAFGFKFKAGKSINDDAKRFNLVSRLNKKKLKVMMDLNGYVEINYIKKLSKYVDPKKLYWLEEPISINSLEKIKNLKKNVKFKIAGYELEQTFEGWKNLILSKTIDIAQPDTIWSGGISECLKICKLCVKHNISYVPHNFASIISLASNTFIAAKSKTKLIEVDSNENPFLWEINKYDTFRIKNGKIHIPDKILGLGINIDENKIEKYRVK